MTYGLITQIQCGVVRGKILIAAVKERTARGIWKSPDQREKLAD